MSDNLAPKSKLDSRRNSFFESVTRYFTKAAHFLGIQNGIVGPGSVLQ